MHSSFCWRHPAVDPRAECKWSKTGGKVEERPAGDEKCNHRAEY